MQQQHLRAERSKVRIERSEVKGQKVRFQGLKRSEVKGQGSGHGGQIKGQRSNHFIFSFTPFHRIHSVIYQSNDYWSPNQAKNYYYKFHNYLEIFQYIIFTLSICLIHSVLKLSEQYTNGCPRKTNNPVNLNFLNRIIALKKNTPPQ